MISEYFNLIPTWYPFQKGLSNCIVAYGNTFCTFSTKFHYIALNKQGAIMRDPRIYKEGSWELVEEGKGSASPWGAWFLKPSFWGVLLLDCGRTFTFLYDFGFDANTTFTCCGGGSNPISCRQHVTRAWWLKHVVQKRINFQIRSLWVCLKEKVWENK